MAELAKWHAVNSGADMLLGYSEAKRAIIEMIVAEARVLPAPDPCAVPREEVKKRSPKRVLPAPPEWGAHRPTQECIGNPSGCVSLWTPLLPRNAVTATDREIHMPDIKKRPVILPLLALLAFVLAGLPAGAQTLKAVKDRGTLNCGVSQGLLGFSSMDDKNIWTGFDVDICRAVAAAIFGDPAKVTFMPLDASARFAALQSNQIDVLSRNSTWTMSRESSLGLMFAGIAYYDGQGFLLRRDAGIDTALQLAGKTVCTQTGTTSELNVTDYFRVNDMALKVLGLGTRKRA